MNHFRSFPTGRGGAGRAVQGLLLWRFWVLSPRAVGSTCSLALLVLVSGSAGKDLVPRVSLHTPSAACPGAPWAGSGIEFGPREKRLEMT